MAVSLTVYTWGAAVSQLVEQFTNSRISVSFPIYSWLPVEVSLDMTYADTGVTLGYDSLQWLLFILNMQTFLM